MDRKISQKIKKQKHKWRVIKLAVLPLLFMLFIFGFRSAIKPSIQLDELVFDTVHYGPLQASVTASGTLIPEFDEIISSPVNSKVIEIHQNVGNEVKSGDTILMLDISNLKSNLESEKDLLAVKQNNILKQKIQFEKSLIDLQSQYDIKKLNLENSEVYLKEEKYLNTIGGSTKAKIKQAELDLKISQLELKRIEQSIENIKLSEKAEIKGLQLEIEQQNRSVTELYRKINASAVIAKNTGVITWIIDQIGKSVSEGGELVKVANLESFEVLGSISDQHSEKLQQGGLVQILLNNENKIKGNITSIVPEISENIISFTIRLEQKKHELFRPNLQVDVLLITSKSEKVLRLKNKGFYNGGKQQMVYEKINNKLVAKEINTGITNNTHIEITNGLKQGDVVAINDLKEYKKHHEIQIK